MSSAKTSSNEYKALLGIDSSVLEPVKWLKQNGHDPDPIVAIALKKLKDRGRHLPWETKVLYVKRIVLSMFFREWASKHAGMSEKHIESEHGGEFRVLRLTIIALADERCFDRIAPKLGRIKAARGLGIPIGGGHEFAGYAATQVDRIASKFIHNFRPDHPGAERGAVKYIEKLAVSLYLRSVTKPSAGPPPGVFEYLIESTRMSKRSVLAFKMRNFPDSLTHSEQRRLRDEYGYSGPINRMLMVKEIAKILGYPSGPALSKKLHKIKKWFETSGHASLLQMDEEDWS